jgi:hypothetical protein
MYAIRIGGSLFVCLSVCNLQLALDVLKKKNGKEAFVMANLDMEKGEEGLRIWIFGSCSEEKNCSKFSLVEKMALRMRRLSAEALICTTEIGM